MCDKGPCASLRTSVAPVDTLFSPFPGIAVGRNGGLCLAPRHATSSRARTLHGAVAGHLLVCPLLY